jgi:hypothetical protein
MPVGGRIIPLDLAHRGNDALGRLFVKTVEFVGH